MRQAGSPANRQTQLILPSPLSSSYAGINSNTNSALQLSSLQFLLPPSNSLIVIVGKLTEAIPASKTKVTKKR